MNTRPATLGDRWESILKDRATFCLQYYVIWLNSGGPEAEDFRELTELIAKALREKSEKVKSTADDRYKATLYWGRKTRPVIRRIAIKYPTVPEFCLPPTPGEKPFFSATPLRKDLRGTWDLEACYAFGYLQEIVAAGLLSNIGRCELQSCRRYFWGRIGRLFCSDQCMRMHMRQAPQYKKKNATYQRKYYDKNFRAKPRARVPARAKSPFARTLTRAH
jgi:hypothetical protein